MIFFVNLYFSPLAIESVYARIQGISQGMGFEMVKLLDPPGSEADHPAPEKIFLDSRLQTFTVFDLSGTVWPAHPQGLSRYLDLRSWVIIHARSNIEDNFVDVQAGLCLCCSHLLKRDFSPYLINYRDKLCCAQTSIVSNMESASI